MNKAMKNLPADVISPIVPRDGSENNRRCPGGHAERGKIEYNFPMASSKDKTPHPLLWVAEPLMDEPSYMERAWFGCEAIYLHGLLVLVLCSGEEPWNGVMIPTGHEFHDTMIKDFPDLVRHSVLKKWLYLSEDTENFEATASEIVDAIRTGDRRFGVEPRERKKRRPG